MAILPTFPRFASIALLPPFAKKKREHFLIHGNSVQNINRNFEKIDGIASLQHSKRGNSSTILLASPYVNAYVHETIRLSKKDLPAVDRQTLPFSRSLPEHIRIDSVAIDQNRAVTVHSHLTDRGVELLGRSKKKLRWQPAIAFFVKKLAAAEAKIPISAQSHILIFENEVLQIEKRSEDLRFSHFSLWPQHLPTHRIGIVKALVEADRESTSFFYVSIADIGTKADIAESSAIHELLSAPETHKVKSVSYIRKKRKWTSLRSVPLQYVLPFTLLCTVLFAVASQSRLTRLKIQRHSLSNSIETLKAGRSLIEPIIQGKREYDRLSSLMEAISQSRLDPPQLLARIHSILPKTTWINGIFVDDGRIALDLFDTGQVDVALLLEQLSMFLGKPNLELNEDVVLQNRKVKRYKLILNELITTKSNTTN